MADEVHTNELEMPKPSAFEVETAIKTFKKYKSPSSYQI
jgi:hypothetical protein